MPWRRSRTLARGLLFCGIAGVTSGCGTGRSSEYKIPTDAAKQTNPFPATPESIAKGKELYVGGGCVICHGKDGDGKGVLARDITMNLHDWRDPSVQGAFSDGELFYVIKMERVQIEAKCLPTGTRKHLRKSGTQSAIAAKPK